MDLYTVLFSTGLITATYFLLNPNKFRSLTQKVSWYSVSTYHRFNLFWSDYWDVEQVEVLEDEKEEEEEEEEENEEEEYLELEGLDKNGELVELEKYKEDELNEELDILFLKYDKDGKTYYKKVEEESIDDLFNYELKILPRQFLQVEMEDEENKSDIHEHISKYYVENNVIFDEIFLKYYMKKWYNMEISNNYKINIIDKDIKLLSLKNDTYLKLNETSYKKLTNE